MKCVQIGGFRHGNTQVVVRVTNQEAKEMVATSKWDYVPKWVWKKQTRKADGK